MDDDRPPRLYWFEDITSPPRVPGYKYFDTPDGEDVFKKMWFTTKWATVTGAVLSTYDILMYSHPKGYGAAAARVGYFIGPLVGMGLAYCAVTHLATNYRKKDDHLNHALGGLMASSVYGIFRKGVPSGAKMALFLVPMACVVKDSAIKNYELFPLPKKGVRDFRSIYQDYSLLPNDKPSYGPRE